MTEWHVRYNGRGVMIYWHMERRATCIYSQLKRCSSSEVGAMIEGVLRHCTDMEIQRHYVDSHGQSEVAFAFCHLLGFELAPRLKAIARQKLYLPDAELARPARQSRADPDTCDRLGADRAAVRRDDQIHRRACGAAPPIPEAILRRFARHGRQAPDLCGARRAR